MQVTTTAAVTLKLDQFIRCTGGLDTPTCEATEPKAETNAKSPALAPAPARQMHSQRDWQKNTQTHTRGTHSICMQIMNVECRIIFTG